ncbi:MAG: hypothetical protein VKJ02_03680 [Snowella sp.]|nr:hypothetical protein [Snowella sp.]
MVERPIKKSERQANPEGSNNEPREAARNDNPGRPPRGRGKGKGKGKKGDRQEEAKVINPALARPPKPSKPQPPVVEETPVEEPEETVAETETATEETPEDVTE